MDQDSFNRLLGKTAAERLIRAREHSFGEHRDKLAGPTLTGTIDSVDYISDAASAHLDATLETMASIDRPIIWIAGTLPAGVDRAHVLEFLRERIAALVLYGRTEDLGIESLKPFTEHVYSATELRTAVFVARELAREGETVLFSPACPAGSDGKEGRRAEFERAVNDL